MSKMQARQTRVVYSVKVPGGKSVKSSSFIATKSQISVAHHEIQFGLDGSRGSTESFEVEELMIQEMRRHGVAKCVQHGGANVWDLLFEVGDESFDSCTLQIALRAAKVTRNDRKVALGRILRDVAL